MRLRACSLREIRAIPESRIAKAITIGGRRDSVSSGIPRVMEKHQFAPALEFLITRQSYSTITMKRAIRHGATSSAQTRIGQTSCPSRIPGETILVEIRSLE